MDDIAVPSLHNCSILSRSDRRRPIILVMLGQSGLLITGCWAVFVLKYMHNPAYIGPRNSEKKEYCAIGELRDRTQTPWSRFGSNLDF